MTSLSGWQMRSSQINYNRSHLTFFLCFTITQIKEIQSRSTVQAVQAQNTNNKLKENQWKKQSKNTSTMVYECLRQLNTKQTKRNVSTYWKNEHMSKNQYTAAKSNNYTWTNQSRHVEPLPRSVTQKGLCEINPPWIQNSTFSSSRKQK